MRWLPGGPNRSVRSQLTIVLTLALIASLMVIVPAFAAHEEGEFELDKNATNDLNVTPVGYLASNINASTTSINVCQTGDVPAADDTILIRAERMTVTANGAGNFGGNCPGDKRTYEVTRGVDGTTAAAQSGGANNIGARVSLIEEEEDKPGVDWDQVYTAYTGGDDDCSTIGLVACVYIHDMIGPTTFTIGSTKDHLPLSGWFHTDGASPDKAEILSAYAAKAINGDDEQLLYFGMDRYAVDGSTDIGFWFFQDEVFACPDAPEGACDGVPDGEFVGEHIAGDLLVLSTFTEGGAQSDIRVFTWVDSGGSEQENIDATDPSLEYGDCVDDVGATDDGCATVNNTTIEAPWGNNYQFKGAATGGWIPAGGFFEGGVNLTTSGLDGCFSSFLAETRSSPEITAILKDFALGAFEACDSDLTTTPADGSGTVITDDDDEDGLIDVQIGTGSNGVNVTDSAVLTINGIAEWSGTLDFYICGPIASGLCDSGGVLVTDDLAVNQGTSQPIVSGMANLTSVGRYCWRAVFTSNTDGVPGATDASAGECFEVLPVTPVLTTTAWSTGDATGSAVTTAQPFGTTLYDRAHLTGTANQPGDNGGDGLGNYTSINATNGAAANGSITFTLVDQTECDATTPVGVSSGSNPETGVTVMGDGFYFSSGVVPSSPGDYTWQASYTGDPSGTPLNTLGTSHNDACDQGAEHVSVLQLNPAISTAQSFVPNDAATISVASGAGDLAGTVVFKLYKDDGDLDLCEAEELVYETPSGEEIDISTGVGDGLSRTVMSSNTTAFLADSTFYWVVEYTSANTAHTGVTSPCGTETSSITIVNNAGS